MKWGSVYQRQQFRPRFVIKSHPTEETCVASALQLAVTWAAERAPLEADGLEMCAPHSPLTSTEVTTYLLGTCLVLGTMLGAEVTGVWFPRALVTKYDKIRGLKRQKCIASVWKLNSHMSECARLPEGSSSWSLLAVPDTVFLQLYHSLLYLSHHMDSSPHVRLHKHSLSLSDADIG